ncbi:hypothetical protein ACQBAU_05060 [Propionibacteriaceae bacterium Y2011]
MRTIREVLLLTAATGRLWLRGLGPLVAWFCVGWALRQLGTYGSAALGGTRPWLSILVFVVGVVCYVISLVLMINSLEPRLAVLPRVERRQAAGATPAGLLVVPDSVFELSSARTVLVTAIGPFLAVYALWGLVDDEVRELFTVNVIRHSLFGTAEWSINMQNWQTYAVMAVIAWLLRVACSAAARRFDLSWLSPVAMVADGVFVFTSFLGLTRIVSDATDWLHTRTAWVETMQLWRGLIELLPEVTFPYGLTLPDLVQAAAHRFWVDVVPGFAQLVLLPLMWLALTALVFGWRDFERSVVGTRAEGAARTLTRLPAPLRRFTWLATGDLRDKYIPVFRSLQLVWLAGPRFLGAFLVVSAVVTALQRLVETGLLQLRGPVPLAEALLTTPTIDLVQGLLGTTVAMALYGAAFDRCIGSVTGTDPDGTTTDTPTTDTPTATPTAEAPTTTPGASSASDLRPGPFLSDA